MVRGAEIHNEPEPHAEPKPIAGYVWLAAFLAAAIASGIGVLVGDEVTTPETYAKGGSQYDAIIEFSVAGILALGCAVIVWSAFYYFVFRHRAKLWKALLALLVVVLTTMVIAVPVRISTLVLHYMADDDLVRELRQQDIVERRELKARMAPNLDGLRMDAGWPEITRAEDLSDHLARLKQAREQVEEYRVAVNRALEQSRDKVQALDIYGSVKEEAVAYYNDRLDPTSNVQRHLASTEAILDQGADLISYLLEHRRSWVIERRRIAVMDAGVLDELNRRASDLDDIGSELDHLEGAMGIELQEPAEDGTLPDTSGAK